MDDAHHEPETAPPSDIDLASILADLPIPFGILNLNREYVAGTKRFVQAITGEDEDAAKEMLQQGTDSLAIINEQLNVDATVAFDRATNSVPTRVAVGERVGRAGVIPACGMWLSDVVDDQGNVVGVSVGIDSASSNQTTTASASVRANSVFGEWAYDANLNQTTVNDRWFEILGYDPDEIDSTVERFWAHTMHPDDRNRLDVGIAHQLIPVFEFRMRHKEGDYRWYRNEGWVAEVNPDRSISKTRGLMYNVDEEHRNRTAIATMLDRTLDAIDSTAEGLIAIDASGEIVSANDTALRLLLTHSSVVGTLFDDTVDLRDSQGRSLRGDLLTGSLSTSRESIPEATLRRSDGSELLVSVSAHTVISDKSAKGAVLVRLRDLSNLIRVVTERDINERLGALGRLASGVAHDFNNLLSVAHGAGEIIQFDPNFATLSEATKESIRLMIQSTDQAADLTSRLLQFNRTDTGNGTNADVNRSVRATAEILRLSLNRRSKVDLDLGADDTFVAADPAVVDNALLNIGLNAQQAMPKGGTITMSTQNVTLDDEAAAASSFDLEPGNYIQIEVSDEGNGIDPDDLPHIFEPFFSTRSDGTGLGLVSVFRLAVGAGGSIEVDSTPGEGTTMRMLLPATAKSVQPEPVQQASDDEARTATQHNLSVLLAEDDDSVARVAASMLGLLGCTVQTVNNGAKLMDALSEGADPDVIFLDLRMPTMDGSETLTRLRESGFTTPIVIISGLVTQAEHERLQKAGASEVVQKPLTIAGLDQVLASVTAEG